MGKPFNPAQMNEETTAACPWTSTLAAIAGRLQVRTSQGR